MTPNPASASSTNYPSAPPVALQAGPTPAIGHAGPIVHSRQDHAAGAIAWDDDYTDTLTQQDSAALNALSYQFTQIDAPDSANLADIVNLFRALKGNAELIDYALVRLSDSTALKRLSNALVAFLRKFNHALAHQPDLAVSLDAEAIRTLCHGLSVCASPRAGKLFDNHQASRAGPALRGITDTLLTRLDKLGMPEAASANGVVLDILNWVSRGLKSRLLEPSDPIRDSYRQALELFASWLRSDHSRGFLSAHQLAKCAVQIDLMVKRQLVSLAPDTPQGIQNRALLPECGRGLCSPATLALLVKGRGIVDAVSLINLCNAVRTLLERRLLRADDSTLMAPLAQLLELIVRVPSPQLCADGGQTLSNCSNFLRTLIELGIHNQPGFKSALPALEQGCRHLIAAIDSLNQAQGYADSQAISNLMSFVKLCDKRLQQADGFAKNFSQADLIRAAGILHGQLMMRDVAAFDSAEAIGGLLSGLCYLWRRGLVAPSSAAQQWLDELMGSVAGMRDAVWNDKSRAVVLPALDALMEMGVTTLAAAQPALSVLMRAPASASSGYTRADLAQAIRALGVVEEAISALPADETAHAECVVAPAPPGPVDRPKLIPGLTQLVPQRVTPAASPLTSSGATPDRKPQPHSSGKAAQDEWRTPARVAHSALAPASMLDPEVTPDRMRGNQARASASMPSWSDASTTMTTTATSATTTTTANTAKNGSAAKRKNGGSRPLKPAQQWFAQVRNMGNDDGDLKRLDELAARLPGLVNREDESGRNALFHAITAGNTRVVSWLMAHKDYVAPTHAAQFLDALMDETLLCSDDFCAALGCFLQAQPAAVKEALRAHFVRKPPMMNGLAAMLERCGLAAPTVVPTKDTPTVVHPKRAKPGPEVSVDGTKSFEQYYKEAKQGNADAQVNLGLCYQSGIGVMKDERAAFGWYRKAADQGDADAQTTLGNRYLNGIGVMEDEKAAVGWYRKAEKQGNADAQTALGICYQNGFGVMKDEKAAVDWYRKAADQGDANAQANLGNCYHHGIGVMKDEKAAFGWYRKAADQEKAGAQTKLGFCYHQGIGVMKDEKAAFGWYRKAAEQGNADAQTTLGICYQNGIGVMEDEKAAFGWYRKAAEQGHAVAQTALGFCYQNGIGVMKDEKAAVEWYRKAAEQEEADAQANLGNCYQNGIGVIKDERAAV